MKRFGEQWEKQFLSVFRPLTDRYPAWRVWADFVELAGCTISNVLDKEQFEKREKRYLDIVGNYEKEEVEAFAMLMAIVTQALYDDPDQDFLGKLFMCLELGNHWKGQFFTPYDVCRLMADMQVTELHDRLQKQGVVSVNDCACGAGALLIAFANAVKRFGVNFQQHVLFVAQDLDRVAAMMCYIQLSLLGCPGYVLVGDTLKHPPTNGLAGQEVWYTPMYFSDIWSLRRRFASL